MTSEKTETRRQCSAAVQAQVVAECAEPGASVAKVAMSHGINANVVHRWRCRFPFKLSLLIFQLAQLTLSSCHQPLALPVSGQGVIDLLLGRDLEDAGRGRINE